jgi:ketosteroid isomerase-like protein
MSDDTDALVALAARYARGVDRRDVDVFCSAFHPDATLTVVRGGRESSPMTGHAHLARVIDRIARYDATHHMLGQSTYEVDPGGEHATGEVYCVASHLARTDSGATNQVMYIRYLDAYTRLDSAWRISARQVVVDWSEVHDVGSDASGDS